MKIAIVGSREYPKLNLVSEYVKTLEKDVIIISGGAKGVDLVAEQTARQRGFILIIHYADWNKGKGAGLARNSLIVADADLIVAFWDGKSTGTLDTLKKAKKAKKPYEIYGPSGKRLR